MVEGGKVWNLSSDLIDIRGQLCNALVQGRKFRQWQHTEAVSWNEMGTCGAHRLVSMTGAHWMKEQEAGYKVNCVVCNPLGRGREFRFWSKRDGKPLESLK